MARVGRYAPWMARKPKQDAVADKPLTLGQQIVSENATRLRNRGIKDPPTLRELGPGRERGGAGANTVRRIQKGSNATIKSVENLADSLKVEHFWWMFYPNLDPDDPPVVLSKSQVELLEAWGEAQKKLAATNLPEEPLRPKVPDVLTMPPAPHGRVLKAFYNTKKASIRALIKERTLFDAEFAERNKGVLDDD